MIQHVRRRLEAHVEVFRSILDGVDEEQARWRPAPGTWSLLEVVNHLADEERRDFRARLQLLLQDRGEAWPPIDPPRWVVDERYNERALGPSLEDFLSERARSLRWLDALGPVDLSANYPHPVLGPITAGDLLASWMAHDLLHVRQMTRLHYEFAASQAAPWSPAYAGAW